MKGKTALIGNKKADPEALQALKAIYDSLTDEQKERAKACKTTDELVKLAGEEGIELSDEMIEAAAGGVQAGFFTSGGSKEFGGQKQDDPKPPRRTWL